MSVICNIVMLFSQSKTYKPKSPWVLLKPLKKKSNPLQKILQMKVLLNNYAFHKLLSIFPV